MRKSAIPILAAVLPLGGCASRPVKPPLANVDDPAGCRLQTRQPHFRSSEKLVTLALSGGGTRAAASSYGVVEFQRLLKDAGLCVRSNTPSDGPGPRALS